ncbi:MAG: thiamine pyrophosphate-binding protein [Pseudomonadota bacterium]
MSGQLRRANGELPVPACAAPTGPACAAPSGPGFLIAWPIASRIASWIAWLSRRPYGRANIANAGIIMSHDWSADVFAAMKARDIATVCTIPDGGLTPLLQTCERDPDVRVVTLTTEEEGIGITTGLWLGGSRAMIAMQSSGVGNCVNALGLPHIMHAPCLMLITMRGQWGEFNPWQVLMGQGTEPVLRQMGVKCFAVDKADEVGETFGAAADLAFNGGFSCAVMVSQRVIGAKGFGR